jgi:hypothetical protein
MMRFRRGELCLPRPFFIRNGEARRRQSKVPISYLETNTFHQRDPISIILIWYLYLENPDD